MKVDESGLLQIALPFNQVQSQYYFVFNIIDLCSKRTWFYPDPKLNEGGIFCKVAALTAKPTSWASNCHPVQCIVVGANGRRVIIILSNHIIQ
jgi:hypothetical protein